MFLFFFIQSFTINMLYISVYWTNTGQWGPMQTSKGQQRPTKANEGQWRLIKAHSSQCKPRKTTKIPQQSAEIGPYVLIPFIHSFTIDMLYISVHWTNAGQWGLTQTNKGQQRPIKANTGQQRLIKAHSSQRKPMKTIEIPQQSAEIAQGMFLFPFIHSFTINMSYISVHWTNAGQWRATQTNEGQ